MTENTGFFFHMVKITVRAGIPPRKIAAKAGVSIGAVESWLESKNPPPAGVRNLVYAALSETVREASSGVQGNIQVALDPEGETSNDPSTEGGGAVVGDLCYLPYATTAFEYIPQNSGIGDRRADVPAGSYVTLIGASRGLFCVSLDGGLVWVTDICRYHSYKKDTPKSGAWY